MFFFFLRLSLRLKTVILDSGLDAKKGSKTELSQESMLLTFQMFGKTKRRKEN